jgi:uncharacterized DUF497 family protein
MKFEYDSHKSEKNKTKHGIDFEEAQALWNDDDLLILPLRFEAEPRQACIGRLNSKHWTAIMTCRGDIVRLISVRRSRKDEVYAYESTEY